MSTEEFIGEDFERAYAKVFNAAITGGLRDGGRDLRIPGFGYVQIKASVRGGLKSLAKALEQHNFIPLCIGDPGPKEDMLSCLRVYGAWVGLEIADRMKVMEGVLAVRNLLL